MHIIANKWSLIAEGYRAAKVSSTSLTREWSTKLQDLSSQLSPLLTRSKSQQKKYLFYAITSLIASLTIILAIVTLPLAIYFIIRYRSLKKENGIIASLPSLEILPEWWRRLESGYGMIEKDGDHGEVHLLTELDFAIPDNHIAIRSILVDTNLDIDVLLMGNSGVWNLESKYWTGKVTFSNGKWSRYKEYYETGGRLVGTTEDPKRGFDAQWQHESEELQVTLERKGGAKGAEMAKAIKGGLVFTHPNVKLSIDPSCPVKCGNTDDWVKEISTSPEILSLDTQTQLATLDALLRYSDRCETRTRSSAVDLAQELSRSTGAKIKEYVEYCERWLSKASVSAADPIQAPPAPSKDIPSAAKGKPSAPVAASSPRKPGWWVAGGVALMAIVSICAIVAVLTSGFNSPKACATTSTKIYSEPISKASSIGTMDKNGCVQIDGRTTGGWGRITGLSIYRGKWVYLGVFKYDAKEVSDLPVIKP
jgi:hypothetical protein